MKISTSLDRFSHQIREYAAKAAAGDEHALDLLDYYLEARRVEMDPVAPSAPCLEYALRTSEKLCEKTRASEVYSQNLYAALCNNVYESQGARWHASWRRCGAVVAHMRERGDYMDWYCSGIFMDEDPMEAVGYLSEGQVSDEISSDLRELGWTLYDESIPSQE